MSIEPTIFSEETYDYVMAFLLQIRDDKKLADGLRISVRTVVRKGVNHDNTNPTSRLWTSSLLVRTRVARNNIYEDIGLSMSTLPERRYALAMLHFVNKALCRSASRPFFRHQSVRIDHKLSFGPPI